MIISKIIVVLLTHWLADFVLQTEDQATKKSSDTLVLATHVLTYSIATSLIWMSFVGFNVVFVYVCAITFISHFITDYFTSKITKTLWKENDIRGVFQVVGLDQILHYVQLALCWLYLVEPAVGNTRG